MVKKRIAALSVIFFIFFAMAAENSVWADGESFHLIDGEGLINQKYAQKIESAAEAVYETNGVELFAYVTGNTISDPDSVGEGIYSKSARTASCALLLIDSSKTYIRTYGRARNIFTSDELSGILSQSTSQKSDAERADRFITLMGNMLAEKGVQPVPDTRLLPRVTDDARLLTDSEYSGLLQKLNEISERQQIDVVVVTKSTIGGEAVDEYAKDFYDYNGFGSGFGTGDDRDGIMLLLVMDTREWAIDTHGKAISIFTDSGQEYMTDDFVSYFSDGDYYEGFVRYAELCDDYITQYNDTGKAYDSGNLPKDPFGWGGAIIGSSLAGLLIGFIVAMALRSGHKSVKAQTMATAYTKQGSMKLTERNDIFLYHNVTRVARPKDNDSGSGSHSSRSSGSHTSFGSSGSSHGGSHGHF